MRHGYVSYWKIPGGEIQFGHRSRKLVVWFRGRCYVLKKTNWAFLDREIRILPPTSVRGCCNRTDYLCQQYGCPVNPDWKGDTR
jgi:hypothetical protein